MMHRCEARLRNRCVSGVISCANKAGGKEGDSSVKIAFSTTAMLPRNLHVDRQQFFVVVDPLRSGNEPGLGDSPQRSVRIRARDPFPQMWLREMLRANECCCNSVRQSLPTGIIHRDGTKPTQRTVEKVVRRIRHSSARIHPGVVLRFTSAQE